MDQIEESRLTINNDPVNHPNHYAGQIEVIDYIRDKLTEEGFTEYCCGNVLKYISRWRKKDGVQDLKKAMVYLNWMIDSAEKENEHSRIPQRKGSQEADREDVRRRHFP